MERLAIERHNAAELARHLEEFRPDVVAWWSMGCMSLSLIERVRGAGIPGVFVVHDDWLVYGPEYDQWLRMWRGRRRALAPLAERLLGTPTSVDLNRAGTFLFNSRYTLGRALKAGLSAPASVVYPGIDERFLRALPLRPWRWRLAYVGRIDRHKGIDTAVRALGQLPPEAQLSVWGSGDQGYVAEMRRLAQELGVAQRVRFEGWVETDGLAQVYDDADVVVFPVRWEEPFGLVPLEAMGVGRPVVTTASGGTAEFVRRGENALVFETDDPAGLAAAIHRLASDEELRSRLLRAGRETAAQYTLTGFAERVVEEMVRPVLHSEVVAGLPG
jgi:glycosyltransferase involved in cell wall biosynthesis